MNSNGADERYQELVSGGSPARPANALAHFSVAPNTIA